LVITLPPIRPRARRARVTRSGRLAAAAGFRAAAVLVALGARGDEDLVDLGRHTVAEFGCAETAFDNGPVSSGAHPAGVGARTAEQVQPRHHHGLSGAGLAGQHGQPAIELGGRGADGSQRLDTDLREHLCVHCRFGDYCPRQPVVGNRNLRTRRSVNGALSKRTHFSGVPQRVTSSRPPAGTSISRRPSQNTSAS